MSDGAKTVWMVLGIIVLIVAVAALSALITMWAWNFGVTEVVKICGGHVGKIGFITAWWVAFALGIIRGDAAKANYTKKNDS
jgi:hypothetical protein